MNSQILLSDQLDHVKPELPSQLSAYSDTHVANDDLQQHRAIDRPVALVITKDVT